jgi:hypothetical protein
VTAQILENAALLEDLYAAYQSTDDVVRLRVSDTFKRLWRAQPTWVVPYIDRFITEVGRINQPSAQWTVAQLVGELDAYLTAEQRTQAIALLQDNLSQTNDWIVISQTVQTLGRWAKKDAALRDWLHPVLLRLAGDARRSVSGIAQKTLKGLKLG